MGIGLSITNTYLTQKGIEHRDIKQDNIIMNRRGLYLVDKGCSLGTDSESHLPDYIQILDLHARRKAGLVSGTPAYMSIHQAGGDTDPTGNTYASTLVFIETIAGKHPFHLKGSNGKTMNDLACVIHNQNNPDLPLRSMRLIEASPLYPHIRHTHRALQEIVYRGLSNSVQDREPVAQMMYQWGMEILNRG